MAGVLIRRERIFETAPFAACHAATLCETPLGLVSAWFGGSEEGAPDVGIWLAACPRGQAGWSQPLRVAGGLDKAGSPSPCWNPVLYQAPGGPLLLFYKVGPSPRRWWGLLTHSSDGGATWSRPERLPGEILGPIKNKPVLMKDGRLLCPSSTETGGRWCIHIETIQLEDLLAGRAALPGVWQRTKALNSADEAGLIQPTLLPWTEEVIQLLCRSRQGRVYSAWSQDGGRNWSACQPTCLANPNSGIDAVRLGHGQSLLVYNPHQHERTPLCAAVSSDGNTWQDILTLEDQPGEYSYPAVIQTTDCQVHTVYTWQRTHILEVAFATSTAFATSAAAAGL